MLVTSTPAVISWSSHTSTDADAATDTEPVSHHLHLQFRSMNRVTPQLVTLDEPVDLDVQVDSIIGISPRAEAVPSAIAALTARRDSVRNLV